MAITFVDELGKSRNRLRDSETLQKNGDAYLHVGNLLKKQ